MARFEEVLASADQPQEMLKADPTNQEIETKNKDNKKTPAGAGAGAAALEATASVDGMSPYIDVLSNDMLRHKSLPSSPETLCGKIVADVFRPSAIDEDCDTCMTLGAGFVNEAKFAQAEPDYDFDSEELTGFDPDDDDDDFDDDEYDDYDDDDWDFDDDEEDEDEDDGVGTFINSDEDDDDEEIEDSAEGGYFGLGDENASFADSVAGYFSEDPEALKDFITYVTQRKGHKAAAAAKVALNYTLDGQKIVDGFKVMLTPQEASSLPYLDTNKVAISEKVTCSECNEPSWLQAVASCRDCNEFKCASCMESMKDFSGICRRCANSLDGTIGEEPISERDIYLDYFLNNETEAPLFLPEGE